MNHPHDQPLVPPSPLAGPWPPPAPTQPVPTHGASTPPQGWGPAPGPFPGWSGPGHDTDAAQALRSARTALGWAIGAAVGAGIALVLCLVLIVTGGTGLGSMPMEGDYYSETLRGEVVGVPDGSRLTGDRLEYVIGGLLDEYGIDHDVSCPDTAAVTTSTVVVCRGEVDGYDWTGVVVFEDSAGSFAVLEL